MIASVMILTALLATAKPEPIALHWQPRIRLGFTHAEPGSTVYQATIGLTRPLAAKGPLSRVLFDVEAGRYRFPDNKWATTYGASVIINLGRKP